MNEVIIYFMLFFIFIILYRYYKDNNLIFIKNNKNNISNNITNNNLVIYNNGDTPALRGYIYDYKLKLIDEKGGSKPFNNIIINNDNLTANQVNYQKYESYRKKPVILDQL